MYFLPTQINRIYHGSLTQNHPALFNENQVSRTASKARSLRQSLLAAMRVEAQFRAMSYLTVEVEIDHGRVSPKGAEALPEKASGLLTILNPPPLSQLRPIGLAKGQFTVPDNFNAPLPEDILQTFDGK